MSDSIHIAVVGSGYVGLVAAVCFAEMGHSVICVDNDQQKVSALQDGESLIHEKYLPELLQRYRNTRVRFTTDLAAATREAQAIFIAVGTPQSETGDADLSYVEAVASEIARSITTYKESWSATASHERCLMSSPTPNSFVKEPPWPTSFIPIES
jgi:UDPglucose 6-dehydrogenase